MSCLTKTTEPPLRVAAAVLTLVVVRDDDCFPTTHLCLSVQSVELRRAPRYSSTAYLSADNAGLRSPVSVLHVGARRKGFP